MKKDRVDNTFFNRIQPDVVSQVANIVNKDIRKKGITFNSFEENIKYISNIYYDLMFEIYLRGTPKYSKYADEYVKNKCIPVEVEKEALKEFTLLQINPEDNPDDVNAFLDIYNEIKNK